MNDICDFLKKQDISVFAISHFENLPLVVFKDKRDFFTFLTTNNISSVYHLITMEEDGERIPTNSTLTLNMDNLIVAFLFMEEHNWGDYFFKLNRNIPYYRFFSYANVLDYILCEKNNRWLETKYGSNILLKEFISSVSDTLNNVIESINAQYYYTQEDIDTNISSECSNSYIILLNGIGYIYIDYDSNDNETSTTDTNNNKLCFTGRDANIVLGSIDKNILTPMMQYLYLKELTRTIYDIPKLIEKLYSDEEYINCTNIKARESYFKMFLKKHSKTYPALDNFVVSNKKRDYFLTQQGGFAYYTLKLLLQHIPDCVWKAYKQNQTPDLTYLMKDYCGNNTYEQKIEQIKCEFFPKNI